MAKTIHVDYKPEDFKPGDLVLIPDGFHADGSERESVAVTVKSIHGRMLWFRHGGCCPAYAVLERIVAC